MKPPSTRPGMPSLDPAQRARADALVQARWLVGKHTDGSVDAVDIHALARFILTGEDPFAAYVENGDGVTCDWLSEDDESCVLPAGHDDHVFGATDGGAVVRHLHRVGLDADDVVEAHIVDDDEDETP